MGKIASLIVIYKLFLSEIKMTVLINSWNFDDFFGCALRHPLIDTLNFQ